MSENDPHTLEFDFCRDALLRYLRVKWYLSWVCGLAVMGMMIGLGTVSSRIEAGDFKSFQEACLGLATGVVQGLAGSFFLSTALYFLFSHWLAARTAEGLRVVVEGPFFRIIQKGRFRMDRKLHFRSIIDYTTIEGPLMRRFGVMALHMTTTGGGNQPGLQVVGIRDCPVVRDKLAEIDAIRENG